MRKLLKDYPMNEWIEAADGCDFCKAKYQVRITWVDDDGIFGDVEYRISHREDCPERFDIMSPGVDVCDGVNVDVAGWEYHEKPITFRGLELYPLKSRSNIGPCLLCGKLVIRVPLILTDEGQGGKLDFCFACAEEKGILKDLVKRSSQGGKKLSDFEDKIRDNVNCCACGGSLKSSRFINGVCLNKLATWKHPTWKNILVLEKYPEDRASAILCDRCIAEKRQPEYAVEWNEDYSEVKYHKVEDLKDLPPIREEDILQGEPELDFGVAR